MREEYDFSKSVPNPYTKKLKQQQVTIRLEEETLTYSKGSATEVEAMLGSTFEETRIYQDLERQTKLKVAARMLEWGDSVEKVARIIDLPIEEVQQIAAQLQSD